MKLKNFMLLAALASFGFASYGGDDDKASGEGTSLESQAKKVCNGICELQSLAEKAMNGEDVDAEMQKLQDEMADLNKELEAKYGPDGDASDEDKEAFMKAMKDCDCE